MPVPGTPLFEAVERGEYAELEPPELAAELRTFLAHLELTGTIFRSNHASRSSPVPCRRANQRYDVRPWRRAPGSQREIDDVRGRADLHPEA
jgi:hypothetical protein